MEFAANRIINLISHLELMYVMSETFGKSIMV